jgi:hypothetical protein
MSYYPIILGAGIALGVGGLIVDPWLGAIGGAIGLWGLIGWSFEPVNDPAPEGAHGHPDGRVGGHH